MCVCRKKCFIASSLNFTRRMTLNLSYRYVVNYCDDLYQVEQFFKVRIIWFQLLKREYFRVSLLLSESKLIIFGFEGAVLDFGKH